MSRGLLLFVCLGFTGSGVAWAEPARADYVENPLAPHHTYGTIARVGSAVGVVHTERLDATALGLSVGVGQRWGRFALEAEYTGLQFSERGPANDQLGAGHRLGVVGRWSSWKYFASISTMPQFAASTLPSGTKRMR